MVSAVVPSEMVAPEVMAASSKIAVAIGCINRRTVSVAIVLIRATIVTPIRVMPVMMSMPAQVDLFYLFSGETLLGYNAG